MQNIKFIVGLNIRFKTTDSHGLLLKNFFIKQVIAYFVEKSNYSPKILTKSIFTK